MHDIQFLTNSVIIFSAGLIIAWLFRAIGAPPVIGYLVAGIFVGPSGLGLIQQEDVGLLSEFGLILLLFIIGLELSPAPLLRLGRSLFLTSVIQVAMCVGLVVSVVWLGYGQGPVLGVILGLIVALSSTAIVLKQISDHGEANTVTGRMTIGILLIQDILVILVMLCLPFLTLGGSNWQEQLMPAVIGLVGLTVMLLVGRRMLRAFLEKVVIPGGAESITLFSVLVAFGGAWLTGLVGWSLPLGACIAGLLLAEAGARHQIVADILPFRDVFNALFFISLGMLVDVEVAMGNLGWLGLAVGGTLVLKSGVTALAASLSGWPLRASLQIGIGLCTVSEFGYVLAREANHLGLMSNDILTLVTAYALGTMLVGAMLVPLARRIAFRVASIVHREAQPTKVHPTPSPAASPHIIVCGYGTNGHNLAQVLMATGIPFIVVEISPRLVRRARQDGVPVVVGDASRSTILKHAGLDHAQGIVIAINDVEATARIITKIRAARPNVYILADTLHVGEIDELYHRGADRVLAQDYETSISLVDHVLREMQVPDTLINAQLAALRTSAYQGLADPSTDNMAQQDVL